MPRQQKGLGYANGSNMKFISIEKELEYYNDLIGLGYEYYNDKYIESKESEIGKVIVTNYHNNKSKNLIKNKTSNGVSPTIHQTAYGFGSVCGLSFQIRYGSFYIPVITGAWESYSTMSGSSSVSNTITAYRTWPSSVTITYGITGSSPLFNNLVRVGEIMSSVTSASTFNVGSCSGTFSHTWNY